MASNDWWANKLGGKPSSSSPTPAVGPAPSVPYTPPAQQPNVQVNYDPDNDQLVSKARTARMNDRCPECNSGNYFAPQGTQRMRCYDCGYPVIQQGSGAGMPGGSSSGPTQAAKQVGQGGGFNPGTIVDRIG
jgi:ribosomal protein S27AE